MPNEYKVLNLGKGLSIPVAVGEKGTIISKYRKGVHDFEENEVVHGVLHDGTDVFLRIIAEVEKKIFNQLTDEDVKQGGFSNIKELKKVNSDLRSKDTLAIIRYEVTKK